MWTYMFFKFKLEKRKRKVSSHPPSSIPSAISPSPIPHLIIISRIFKISGALIVIMFFCRLLFQKSGTKSRGVLHFVPLRQFYAVLFIPLFCRLREKWGTLWKMTWRHNVDNILQKDIITINVPLLKKLRDIIFFLRDNHFMSHFKGHFEGAPSKCPEKWLIKWMSQKKNYVPKFLKQRDIGNFMSFCNHGPSIMSRSFLNLIN